MSNINNKKNLWFNKDVKTLFRVIIKLKDLAKAQRFFRDLMTEKELIEFGQRWKVARMLAQKVSYVKIVQETGMSSTTIARVHKWLKHGMGGYRAALWKK